MYLQINRYVSSTVHLIGVCLAESNYIHIAGIKQFNTKSVHNEV